MLETAVDLLDTVPIDGLTNSIILERSGVSYGSLYHHYADISDLIDQAVVHRYIRSLTESVRASEALLEATDDADFRRRSDELIEPSMSPDRLRPMARCGDAITSLRSLPRLTREPDTVTGVDLPVLVYDGDCAFCSSSVRLLERLAHKRPVTIAWQLADLGELGLTADDCAAALQWVATDGEHRSGAAAVTATLRHAGRGWRLIGVVLDAPGVRWIAARLYALVARNRHRLPGGTPACAVDESILPSKPTDPPANSNHRR